MNGLEEREHLIYMGFPGERPPYHVYEAVQIFNDCGAFPVLVPNSASPQDACGEGCSGIWLAKDSVRAEIPAFETVGEKTAHKLQKREIYKIMCRFTGYHSPWGCMTGVRPAKIVNSLLRSGMTPDEAVRELKAFYLASPEKAELAVETACNQERFLQQQRRHPENAAVYVGIPFCPTRCLYCSFPSHPIGKYVKSVDRYLTLLEQELDAVIPAVRNHGLRIESLYVGGGTPTALEEEQFRTLLNILMHTVGTEGLAEFSLEAGRPDSITAAKLEAAREAGVTRISINPQTMNNDTLELIGRRHTAEETEQAYFLARTAGFRNINMDVIAGLPGESPEDFAETLNRIAGLRPDALTVHTLSVKRAADLKRDVRAALLRHDVTGKMLSLSRTAAREMGMIPFYMYRQKNMLGNHENVSYCRPGCESPYNIHIMEEDQTIFAFGAGGVSKLSVPVPDAEPNILRSFNVKSVEDYLARSGEMAERKLRLLSASLEGPELTGAFSL